MRAVSPKVEVTFTRSEARHAVRAAKKVHEWGAYATARYLENKRVPLRLFKLAVALYVDTIATKE